MTDSLEEKVVEVTEGKAAGNQSEYFSTLDKFWPGLRSTFFNPGLLTRVAPAAAVAAASMYLMPEPSTIATVAAVSAMSRGSREVGEAARDAVNLYQEPTAKGFAKEVKHGGLYGAILGASFMGVVTVGKLLGIDGMERTPWNELLLYVPTASTVGAVLQPLRAYVEGWYHSRRMDKVPVKDESA